MVKCRIIAFLSYYFESLVETYENNLIYQKYGNFILASLKHQSPVLKLQAIECLNNLLSEEIPKKISNFLMPLFERVIELIPTATYVSFFDMVQELIKYFENKIK